MITLKKRTQSVNRKYNANQKWNDRKTNEIKEDKTVASRGEEPPSHKIKPKPSSFSATNVLPPGKRFLLKTAPTGKIISSLQLARMKSNVQQHDCFGLRYRNIGIIKREEQLLLV